MSASTSLYAEWTLIVFTVLAQFGAGAALFASVSDYYKQESVAQKLWRVAFALMVVAGIVSVLHLQNPFNALYTLTQVGHSWLSREILCVGAFSGLVFLQLLKPHKIIGYIASAMGLVLVYVISQVYASVSAMPFWSNMGTVVGFYGTAFVLGGACTLWVAKDVETSCLRCLAMAALIFGLVLSLASKLSWISVFMQEQSLAIPALFTPSLCHMALQVLFVLMGLVAILPQNMRSFPVMLPVGVLCFLLAELSSRTVFFIAQLKLGV